MTLFGGKRIPWRTPLTVAAADAPTQQQGTPDASRLGRWRGRVTVTRNLAVGVTPARISAALQSADQGYPADLFQLIQEVTDRSPQMVTVLGTRKRGVAQTPWCLEPGGPRPQDRKLAEQVEGWIRRIEDLPTALVHLLSGIENGFAGSEIDWRMVKEGGQILALPKRLTYAPAYWFKPSPADPEDWFLLDAANLADGVPLIADRWITHTHQAKPGFPVQAGLGRCLLWYWLFAHFATKDWVAYSELFGAPMRIGHAPPGAGDDQLDDMEDALAQLGVDSYAVVPPEAKIEFIGDNSGKSGPDVYERLIEYTDRSIAKLVLGQVLTTEASGSGGAGSYALGGVHNAVRMDLLRADAEQLAATMTRCLVEPMVRFNFGGELAAAACPRWVFRCDTPRDELRDAQTQEARGRVFAAALSLGLPVSRAQVAAEMQIKEPAGAGDLLMPRESPDTDEDDDDAEE